MGCPASIRAHPVTGNSRDSSSHLFCSRMGKKPFLILNRSLSPYSGLLSLSQMPFGERKTEVRLLPVLLAFSSSGRTFPDPSVVPHQYRPLTFQEPSPTFRWGLTLTEFSSLILAGLALVCCKITSAFCPPSWFALTLFNFWFRNSFILIEKVRIGTKTAIYLHPASLCVNIFPHCFIILGVSF